MREVWLAITKTSGTKIYSMVLGLVSLALTARWLGPEGRGTVAAITTWVGLLSVLGGLSLGQVALHRATEQRGTPWLGKTLGSLMLIAAIATICGWGIVTLGSSWAALGLFHGIPVGALMLGFAMLPLMIWEQYGSALLMATNRLPVYNRAQIVGRSCALPLVFLFVFVCNWGVYGALLTTFLAQMVVAFWGIRDLIATAGEHVRPDRTIIRSLVGAGLRLHLNAVGAFFSSGVDILLLQHYHGMEQTGYYQFAVQLVGVAMVIPQSASMVLYTKVASLGVENAWAMSKRMLIHLVLLMLCVGGIAALLAPILIPRIAGARFSPSVPVFQLLLLTLVGQTFSTTLASQWIGRGLFWPCSILTMVAGLISVGAGAIVIPRHGMYGAVWVAIGMSMIAIIGNTGMAIWVRRWRTR
jgi:O-antigen/teichoic acid export membrane protein